jgi:hypothetical protein
MVPGVLAEAVLDPLLLARRALQGSLRQAARPSEQSRGRVLIVLAMSEQVGENSTPEPLQCSPGEQPRPATREKWPTE